MMADFAPIFSRHISFGIDSNRKMARLEIDNVLSKMKDLEDLIQGGMEITQECALDCEENEEGCPEVKELKNVMLAYASMSRDIKQWDKVARKTVTDFRKNYASSGFEFWHNFLILFVYWGNRIF